MLQRCIRTLIFAIRGTERQKRSSTQRTGRFVRVNHADPEACIVGLDRHAPGGARCTRRGFQAGAGLPWRPFAGDARKAVKPGPWAFFTAEEAAAVEALVDRLIPPDPDTPGGKDCGCAIFIDRQLAGAYGSAAGLYWSPPFLPATPEQRLPPDRRCPPSTGCFPMTT
jgi:Gluconate 2-dehydrogenase subunit 3